MRREGGRERGRGREREREKEGGRRRERGGGKERGRKGVWPTITKLLREAAVNDVRREGEREGGRECGLPSLNF